MTFRQICEGVIDGSIGVDTQDHALYNEYWTAQRTIADHLESTIEGATGKHDGTWKDHKTHSQLLPPDEMEDTNKRMRAHYQWELDQEIDLGEQVYRLPDKDCFHCGRKVYPVYDGDKITYRHIWESDIHKRVTYPIGEKLCDFAIKKPISGKIRVDSKLIFANFFRHIADEPEGQKYDRKWCVNYTAGQVNITKYKSEQRNVAFGQMGNMSVGIYTSKTDPTKIVIASPYYGEDCDSDEIKPFPYKGFEMVGDISLSVWRWEAADLNTIGADKLQEMKDEEYPQDIVELDVPFGEWEFTHWYETQTNPDEDIYSEFNLIKN